MISDKQFELLEMAEQNGGLDREMAQEIYFHSSTAWEAMEKLREYNLLRRETAPPTSTAQYVYFVSDIGKNLVKAVNSDDSA